MKVSALIFTLISAYSLLTGCVMAPTGEPLPYDGPSIDKVGIQSAIRAERPALKNCIKKSSNVESGTVNLIWRIDEKGQPSSVHEKDNGTGSPEVSACFQEVVRSIQFPAAPKDQIAEVTYPFVVDMESDEPKTKTR